MQKVSDKTLVKNNIFGGRNRLKYSSITDLSESKVLINSLRKIIRQLFTENFCPNSCYDKKNVFVLNPFIFKPLFLGQFPQKNKF
jgi:hypothetical protein